MAQHSIPAPTAGPRSPVRLPRPALVQAIKRTVAEFSRDDSADRAAGLTYYAVLSIFPGLLVLVSVVGLMSRSAVQPLLDSVSGIAPGPVKSILDSSVNGLQHSRGTAGVIAVFGLIVAIWSASGYIGAFIRAANVMYDVPEGRPSWKTIPLRLGMTIAAGLLLVASAVIVVVSGRLATAVGSGLGLREQAVTVWGIAKWPVLVVLISVLFGLLYRAAPNARQGGWRWISPGGVVAVALWMLASALFGLYVANFASYDKTYGTLAGVVVFLVWLWLSNLALLFGAELNAELERQRAIAAGLPADAEPYLRPREGFPDRSPG